ncbi:hypothetical protein WA1_32315 [Scytonema hofmannii PCC 7110]|uniref:Uncharacterized protein n=1 Tax=Scytonema hofmannii PCC 7110 TaxID=128403 RepID=A0A139X434_9CYAN|nr:hypothetical protein [Scytonema hofmannii]KYC39413.1 hypothetical protein WA1_32315 [Scytonema hofmannii PCC 7110]
MSKNKILALFTNSLVAAQTVLKNRVRREIANDKLHAFHSHPVLNTTTEPVELVTGHWSLVTGHWSLNHWSLVTGHWSLIIAKASN